MKVRPGSDWRASRDGLWTLVETNGELAPAEREWIHTNGAGAYAMSTIAVMHTRRAHGVFVAALPPPLGRHVIISHAETQVMPESERKSYRLSTHQFPSVAPTPGYRQLTSFAIDPIPRWVFRLGQHTLERTVCLVRGKNALITSYTWYGKTPARLQVRPLMPLRPVEKLVQEHGGMMQVVSLKPGAVEMRPVPSLPPIVFGHEGVFMGSPDWWRRFEYLADRSDGIEFQEDIWTPGVFEMVLEPGRTAHLVAAVGALPEGAPAALVEQTREVILAQDPGESRPASVRVLSVAAEQFCLDAAEQPAIIAGYPGHAVLLREWVMSLPGLHVARGRYDLLARSLETLLPALRGGLLPERLPRKGEPRGKPVPDATLWLFELGSVLEKQLGAEHALLRRLYPTFVRAFLRVQAKRKRFIWLTPEGLVATRAVGTALTWMDAHVGPTLVTPRQGLAVEHQALWACGCELLARLSGAYGIASIAERASEQASRVRSAFRAHFWSDETDYAFDCISEARDTAEAWSDPSIHPNALIALAVAPSLFEAWQAESIIERVRAELLTPRGVRSLSPSDPRYIGQFAGSPVERELAYHRGTVWTHLLGFYARASLRLAPDDMDVYYDLRGLLEHAADDGALLAQVGQLADGDAPHRVRGAPAQATSVAELLRALALDLDV
ncbi:MAG TPA: amylo-alpha-1,6-glucosidase [Polyangiaceae bacterium]|nr:amylo-alpha-1,6-glucosidase [Polyangiaceae bacterium]